MATTRIMPLHTGKGRTVGQAISDIIDYVENPQKTDHGRLITSFQCDSRVADAEFLLAKKRYIQTTGRVRGEDDVIAYHLRQSFVPGEITPEEANRLGQELARRFTKGKMPTLSAPISTRTISTIILSGTPFLWTASESSETSGAVPEPCVGSMIPFALRTVIPLSRTRSPTGKAITNGLAKTQSRPTGSCCALRLTTLWRRSPAIWSRC